MLGSVMITNAMTPTDLSSVDFACYMDANFQPVLMTPTFDATTLTITPNADVNFNSIRAIYYGTLATDLNLCDATTY